MTTVTCDDNTYAMVDKEEIVHDENVHENVPLMKVSVGDFMTELCSQILIENEQKNKHDQHVYVHDPAFCYICDSMADIFSKIDNITDESTLMEMINGGGMMYNVPLDKFLIYLCSSPSFKFIHIDTRNRIHNAASSMNELGDQDFTRFIPELDDGDISEDDESLDDDITSESSDEITYTNSTNNDDDNDHTSSLSVTLDKNLECHDFMWYKSFATSAVPWFAVWILGVGMGLCIGMGVSRSNQ